MRRMLLRPAAWFQQHSEYLASGLLDHIAVELHGPSVEARAAPRPLAPGVNPKPAPHRVRDLVRSEGLNLPARDLAEDGSRPVRAGSGLALGF